jgi:hypothetical protein
VDGDSPPTSAALDSAGDLPPIVYTSEHPHLSPPTRHMTALPLGSRFRDPTCEHRWPAEAPMEGEEGGG